MAPDRRPHHDAGGASACGGFSVPARANTTPSRSITQMRAVVRDSPCTMRAISGDADGGRPSRGSSSARSCANDAIGSAGPANSRGRSLSAIATACAVDASERSCASRRKRSSSRTYS